MPVPDNINPVKLTDLADDLNIKPGILLTRLRDEGITVMMFLRNGIRQQWVLFRDQQGEVHPDSYPEDDEHFDTIHCPINKQALDCLIDNGLFEFHVHTLDTGNESGEQVFCLKKDGFSERGTAIRIKNLYVSSRDAAALKSHAIGLPTSTATTVNMPLIDKVLAGKDGTVGPDNLLEIVQKGTESSLTKPPAGPPDPADERDIPAIMYSDVFANLDDVKRLDREFDNDQQPAADEEKAMVEQGADDFRWGWPAMEEFTGLSRDKIRYRAGQLGFELKKEDPDDPNSKPGLKICQLNKIANYKRSKAVS